MIIKNGLVWEESGSFLTKDLHIDSDTHRIAMDSADTADDTIIDASGLYVIPGLVDIHIHGAMGCDFSDGSAEGLLKIAKYLRSCGVTAFCSSVSFTNRILTVSADSCW
jgi:N-acetylglucosamine-6-phosphate deacetylase